MASITLSLPDMHCEGCVGAVTSIARRLDPGCQVDADLPARRVTVSGALEAAALRQALAKGGFPPA